MKIISFSENVKNFPTVQLFPWFYIYPNVSLYFSGHNEKVPLAYFLRPVQRMTCNQIWKNKSKKKYYILSVKTKKLGTILFDFGLPTCEPVPVNQLPGKNSLGYVVQNRKRRLFDPDLGSGGLS